MKPNYEVWYETEDGIEMQEVDGDMMPVLHDVFSSAKARASELSKAEENMRAWVVERKVVFECQKKTGA